MFDINTALNETDKYVEIEIEHVAHIAAQITNVENDTWVVAVDIVILILTTIGSLIILGNTLRNELRGRGSTTRMRLVQSLIVSDLMMGITGLIGCIQQLAGHPLVKDSVECDGLGVTFTAIVFSQHLWTLALAFTTFMILIHPLSNTTILLEKYWYWNWLFVWAISFAVSVVGYVLYGYGPTGGICYYQDDSGLFGELIQFLPRGVVFVVIAILYGKLYVFLKRPDKIRTGFSNDSGSSWSHGLKGSWLNSRSKSRRKRLFTKQEKTIIIDEHHTETSSLGKSSLPSRGDSKSAPPERTRHHHTHLPHLHMPHMPHMHMPHFPHFNPHLLHRKPVVAEDDGIPPWERVELPPFQVDGQRYGGSDRSDRQNSLLAGFIRRPNSTLANFPQHQRVFSPPLMSPTNTVHEEDEHEHEHDETPVAEAPQDIKQETEGEEKEKEKEMDTMELPDIAVQRAISGTSDGTTAVDLDSPSRRTFNPTQSAPSTPGTLAQTSSEILCPKPMLLPNPENSSVLDLEKGLVPVASPESIDDDDMDLLAMLRSDGAGVGQGTQASHHSSEYIQESMSSYLNRKTALLMLWFPLGYVLLFGVSTVRIIYDFVGNPPTGVRAMSRWMIFGQGLLNLVIYGAVEFHTKRVVRRRVRRGTLNQHRSGRSSGHGHGHGSGIPGLGPFRWPKRSGTAQSNHGSSSLPVQVVGTGSRTGTGSRNGAGAKSPTVSFVDPEMSILQRLDEEAQLPVSVPQPQRGD
ncbi:hypothetical protein A1Q2_05439 [Trichosporon asahii var. asahii CBS 8904]|uniref:Glucose receptor Git3 N-terminal domain-containing protein n=1 Tax=Trichosporon asahii var. asahii (strain CBS 8904) TaxID=1220162 RepID=K1VLQ4_TRIAC|nr:hypothetical protein A1Q2_05439 [Trichosporon asahii var. asahii CBS 8904]